ncbi:MAG TPA: alpha-ketoglutarate decarboxylase [Salinimicrobium sp.]|nr:alpha-ketoglutarate decarboxylase [Salinimicrobium sp.]
MKKLISAFILLIMSSHSFMYSQETELESTFFDNVRFGGSLGLSFSNGFFNVGLAPKAVYDFNRYTSAGVGLMGSYSSASNYKAFNYGGSVLGLFRPFRGVQLSAEFEELHVSRNWELDGANRKDSYWYPALFLGLGYNTGAVTIGMRYDVLYDEEKSIYGNALMPFVSVYF